MLILSTEKTCTFSILVIFNILIATVSQCTKQHRSHETSTESLTPSQSNQETTDVGQTHFSNIQDLEHIAYFSLRNFNLTDEALLQSSHQLGLARQHLKEAGKGESDGDSLTSDVSESSKDKLALMLESFILRLRNGRFRVLSLDELAQIASSYNDPDRAIPLADEQPSERGRWLVEDGSSTAENSTERLTERCSHLVSIYQSEQRQRIVSSNSANRAFQRTSDDDISSDLERESEVQIDNLVSKNQSGPGSSLQFNRQRLMQLCRLVVKCQTAEELMSLIESDGSWWKPSADANKLDREDWPPSSGRESARNAAPAKSLRDALSSSLAKLCPLILFQLHHDEGMCSVRRDDRPPTVTVWAFATLFVTIVSFCSLIGLSITPLLGSSASPDTLSTSDESASNREPARTGGNRHRADWPGADKAQQHRSCLILFEGLAVGSLVGSALFSLIPQAFELQEHESNQGFLLKALIIFLGIYLFFCSERIMRIILDTRRKRKKKKHFLNYYRGSNSIPAPSTTMDYEQHPHYLHQVDIQTSRSGQQFGDQQQAQQRSGSISGGRRNNTTTTSTTTTSRGRHSWMSTDETGRWSLQAGETATSLAEGGYFQQGYDERAALGSCNRRSANDQHIKISNGRVSSIADRNQRGVNFSPGVLELRANSWKWDRKRKPKSARAGDARSAGESGKQVSGCVTDQSASPALPEGTVPTALTCKPLSADVTQQSQPASIGSKTSKSNRIRRNRRRKTRQHQLMTANRRLGRRQAQMHLKALQQRDAESAAQVGGWSKRRRTSTLVLSSSSSSDLDLSASSRRLHNYTLDRSNLNGANSISPDSTLSNNHYDNGIHFLSSECSSCEDLVAKPATKSDDDSELNHGRQQRAVSLHLSSTRQAARQAGQQVAATDGYLAPPGRRRNVSETLDSRPVRKNKREISTVAWMIVLGDGLHNFIDGISIGAAFSESILSGVSISVAVICEEFPHELGDFAVLVSSGMTVRQALGYNFLSACTCYLGMAVGIILGDVNDSASYISALAAGVFLYIALVDMMGELSAALEETSRNSIAKTLKLLLLQNVGIFIGISIIFVLSFIDF